MPDLAAAGVADGTLTTPPGDAPAPTAKPPAEGRSAETAVLDQVAALAKDVADLKGIFGQRPTVEVPAPAPGPKPLCWMHPFGSCPPNAADCPVTL